MSISLARRGDIAAAGAAPFDPTSITGIRAWWDASDLSTFTFGTGTAVAQWNDKSGIGNDVSQGTAAQRPTRSGTQNGRSTLVFDGVNDNLVKSAGPGTAGQPVSVVIALKYANLDTADHVVYNQGGGGPQVQTNTTWQAYAGASLNSGVADDANWNVITAIFNGGSSFIYLNGSQIASGNTGSDNDAGANIGMYSTGASYWAGEIAEILVYSVALSGTDRTALEAYLKTKWGTV